MHLSRFSKCCFRAMIVATSIHHKYGNHKTRLQLSKSCIDKALQLSIFVILVNLLELENCSIALFHDQLKKTRPQVQLACSRLRKFFKKRKYNLHNLMYGFLLSTLL
jgi:hypothetical protein